MINVGKRKGKRQKSQEKGRLRKKKVKEQGLKLRKRY